MSFGQSVSYCFSNYTNFTGRARRSEFWWFYLAVLIISAVVQGLLAVILGADSGSITCCPRSEHRVGDSAVCGRRAALARHRQEWLAAVAPVDPLRWRDRLDRVLGASRSADGKPVRPPRRLGNPLLGNAATGSIGPVAAL